MVLKRLRRMRRNLSATDQETFDAGEDYIEVDIGGVPAGAEPTLGAGKIGIVIESVAEFGDTERVLKHVREGNVVLMKVKALKEKDLGELKRVVERFKRTVLAQNGDIVGVEQDWLLLVPDQVTVHR
ncbi:MAG: cell division protein SepF [Candidatus Aenigmatarchaeota archaeon]|nr:MAG: cell division protein SepF [Candidatus Aenigmarchaeota archaeon]